MLSTLLLEGEGYIKPNDLEIACNFASIIQSTAKPTTEEKVWLSDFILNIGIAITKSRELDIKVEERARGETEPKAGFSKYDNDVKRMDKLIDRIEKLGKSEK